MFPPRPRPRPAAVRRAVGPSPGRGDARGGTTTRKSWARTTATTTTTTTRKSRARTRTTGATSFFVGSQPFRNGYRALGPSQTVLLLLLVILLISLFCVQMQTNQTNKQKNCNAEKNAMPKKNICFSVVVVVVGAASLDLPKPLSPES